MQLSRINEFYRFHARIYDMTRWIFLWNRQEAVRLLDIHPGDTVVDIACGTGLNAKYVLPRLTTGRYIGVDASEDMLAVARKKYPAAQWICQDVTKLDLDHMADRIICTYSLSMIEDQAGVIERMKHLLKPGGQIVILDFFSQWHPLLSPIRWILFSWLRAHGVTPLTRDTCRLCREYFRVVEVLPRSMGYNLLLHMM